VGQAVASYYRQVMAETPTRWRGCFTAAAAGDHLGSQEEVDMYIGIGTVLLIILIVLLVLYVL
jgi:hypothetical protein